MDRPSSPAQAWEAPAELIKRAFSNAPSNSLCTQLRQACLRLPAEHDQRFWTICRVLAPTSGATLLRAWLLHTAASEPQFLEVAANYLQQTHGEHAVALDFLRWVHENNIPALDFSWPRSRALYFKVLRHVAEERAAAAVRLKQLFGSAALNMATEQMAGHASLASFQPYCSQLTGQDLTLFGLTPDE